MTDSGLSGFFIFTAGGRFFVFAKLNRKIDNSVPPDLSSGLQQNSTRNVSCQYILKKQQTTQTSSRTYSSCKMAKRYKSNKE